MKLLDETAVLAEIRALLERSDKARLAVAFWGTGAIERLGLDRPGLSVEILCNLESGACNPKELRRLYELPSVTLKSDPALHAKVYWTAHGVIIGSSNASANGLAVDGEAANSWNEANVLLSDTDTIGSAQRWLDPLFRAGAEVNLDDIAFAEKLWKNRAKLAPAGKSSAKTLLAAFNATPEHPAWSDVKVTYTTDPLEELPAAWLEDEKASGNLHTNVSAYNAAWRSDIHDNDWIVDFAINGRSATFERIWKALPREAYRADFPIVYPCQTIDVPAFGHLQFPDADQQTLRNVADQALRQYGDEGGRNAIIDLRTAMALAVRSAVPTEREFDQAMEAIYVEAKTFGYHPTGFRKMLADYGGVQTARRLLRAKDATSGFTKLWENGRLDLSVEALVLDQKWRALFSIEEHKLAERRLSLYNYEVAK